MRTVFQDDLSFFDPQQYILSGASLTRELLLHVLVVFVPVAVGADQGSGLGITCELTGQLSTTCTADEGTHTDVL